MLVRAELVGGDVYLLVEGEGGPLPLRQGEGEGARAHVLVSLQCEDEVLPRPCPHIHVGTRLTRETLVDTWAIRFYSDSFITTQRSNYTHTLFSQWILPSITALKVHLVGTIEIVREENNSLSSIWIDLNILIHTSTIYSDC